MRLRAKMWQNAIAAYEKLTSPPDSLAEFGNK